MVALSARSPNEIVGKVWPNGEFGLSMARKFDTFTRRPREESKRTRWLKICLALYGLFQTVLLVSPRGKTARLLSLVSGAFLVNPLGSSNLSNSHKKARGRKGITSYGGKMLRNGCFLFEEKYGKHRLSFLTLTLPDLVDGDWDAVVKGWPQVLRVFFQWLTRQQRKAGLPEHYVSATEVQPARFERDGKVALHIHCVFLGRKEKGKWIVTPKQVRQAWKRALTPFLSKSPSSYTWSSVENLVRVRKSVAAYLSKYISKGVQGLIALRERFESVQLPPSWWNCSSRTRKWLKASVQEVCGVTARIMTNWNTASRRDLVLFFKSIRVEVPILLNGVERFITKTVGARGVLTRQGVAMVQYVKAVSRFEITHNVVGNSILLTMLKSLID